MINYNSIHTAYLNPLSFIYLHKVFTFVDVNLFSSFNMFSPFLQGIVKHTALKRMLTAIVPEFSNTVLRIEEVSYCNFQYGSDRKHDMFSIGPYKRKTYKSN